MEYKPVDTLKEYYFEKFHFNIRDILIYNKDDVLSIIFFRLHKEQFCIKTQI